MERKSDSGKKPPADRETRLKAALKANLARRKAQAKARSGDWPGETAEKEKKE